MTETNFVYVLKLIGSLSPSQLTLKQQSIVDEHFEYLKNAFAQGKLSLAGRCLGCEFGIVIFQAYPEPQAEESMLNDPAVKQRVMKAELYPFRICLMKRNDTNA